MDLCSAVEKELAQVRQLGEALLHRDFHPGQILFSRDSAGIGVLDWDDAALGEPELDLGNLEAHLFLDDLQRRGSIGSAPRLAEALRAGYLAQGDINFTHLATYRRAALLRLATLERLADPRISVLDRESLAKRLTEIVLSAT
jgi:aminoglycoside phosphotransferase (APT) family kinase protein